MAHVELSPEEAHRIEGILDELRPTVADFFADALPSLPAEDWDLLLTYATTRMRVTLELSTCLRAVAGSYGCPSGAFPGRGEGTFVKGSLKAWRDSYSPIKEPWRVSLVAERIDGGERRVMADVATLEALAASRMFESFEQECVELLGGRD